MSKKDVGIAHFEKGFNCAQAVVVPFCEELGIDKNTALKFATGFGGGMRRGQVCGAITGALMVLGLNKGFTTEGDMDEKARANAVTKEFITRFEAKHGKILCKELLGYDVSKPEDVEKINELDLHKHVCQDLIRDSIEIVEEMIQK